MQKLFIVLGILFLLIGLAYPWLSRIGIGQLPGDFLIRKGHFTFYFPLATSIIISIVLTILLRFFK